MRRIIWLAVGVGVGVYAVTRLRKRAEALAPAGIRSAVERLSTAIEHAGENVRAGMAEREGQLREALGLDTSEK